MSLTPPSSVHLSDISLYATVQVAVTCAALYDHVLSLGREIDLIWMKPPSLVTVLYVIDRYLGDVNELVFVLFSSKLKRACSPSIRCIRLFEFRAWGALIYSWATQATMQLRIYALYRQSKRILVLMFVLFLCEVAAIAFVIWRTIGPGSALKATNDVAPGGHFCAFSGINPNFIYIFIPFLCFEAFLFFLAARIFIENMKRSWDLQSRRDSGTGATPFISILARDSICYFFVNLIACAVVMGLWQSVTELYANICIPFVMFLEVIVGTRLILDFRERYARSDDDDGTVSDRYSSMHFRGERGDDARPDSTHVSVRCQVDTIVVTDGNEAA
ncbi:hypothetical protein JVU11DRAFT_4752 [Chiua virens]|nr:hypothetical protein JVU11DRAFT_4752 [Chiua virens]